MDINFAKMTLELLKYNKVIFYGAGDIAQMLYGELLKRRVNIDACVVTDIEKNGKSFLGKVPIYQVDECVSMLREKGTIILIAVTNKFVQQIEKILYDLNIKNYFLFKILFNFNKILIILVGIFHIPFQYFHNTCFIRFIFIFLQQRFFFSF